MRKGFRLVIAVVLISLMFIGCDKQNGLIPKSEKGSNQEVTNESMQVSDLIVNNFSDAIMEVVEGSVTNTGITVQFQYSGNDQGQYGSWYSLEIEKDGSWYILPYTFDGEAEVGWTSEAYLVEKGEPKSEQVNWEWLYGELPAGRYRIIKDFIDFRGTGDYTQYNLASEFTIK